ncbi:hypothetical protein PoB_007505700 [Plakobranchus ocellatus]|uniref:Uncharacterized protein n=1 Tax=Plakobranchus ocellatus TaxID=259542 RepID=A0AAV4DW67_9GAST|nr:hypothetical protein PoB_007505700 [Plakobranchus ocellatus]
MVTRSLHQRISLTGVLGHPLGRSLPSPSTGSKHAELFLPVPRKDDTQWWQTNLVALGPTESVCFALAHHSCADIAGNHLPCKLPKIGRVAYHYITVLHPRVKVFRGCGWVLPSFLLVHQLSLCQGLQDVTEAT